MEKKTRFYINPKAISGLNLSYYHKRILSTVLFHNKETYIEKPIIIDNYNFVRKVKGLDVPKLLVYRTIMQKMNLMDSKELVKGRVRYYPNWKRLEEQGIIEPYNPSKRS